MATALDERGLELGLYNDRRWSRPLLPGDVEWVSYENELNTPPEEKIDADRRFFDRTLGERAATTDPAHDARASRL